MKRTVKIGGRAVEYTLISSSARTNLLLQALPEGRIRLYAPAGLPLREADRLVRERIEWIDEMHRRIEGETPARAAFDPAKGIPLEGRRVPVEIVRGAANRAALKNGVIRMTTTFDSEAEQLEQLRRFLIRRALERIREELERWAPTVGRPYGRVAIREQRTRWGSCSSRGNLNFNWKLILAPPEALTYVVIHELCHLKDFNHSPRFWAEVRARMPEYEAWKKWLHTHGKELTFPPAPVGKMSRTRNERAHTRTSRMSAFPIAETENRRFRVSWAVHGVRKRLFLWEAVSVFSLNIDDHVFRPTAGFERQLPVDDAKMHTVFFSSSPEYR